MNNKPIIGITMGDPAGIGAEVTVKALNNADYYRRSAPLVLGDAERIRQTISFLGLPLKVREIEDPSEAKFEYGVIDVLRVDNPGVSDILYGQVSALAGEAAVSYVFKAIELAQEQKIDAIVTAPLNKEAIHLAGYNHYSGHTEILAEKTNTADYAMMLSVKGLYVIHVSTHCSLRQACDKASKSRIKKVIELANEVVKTYNLPNPLIAVAGLNPHSGENGAFGTEEIEQIIPAIEEARLAGMKVIGPVPPDSLFVRAMKGEYQVMIVMYHDQGHVPVKVIGFDNGVNITIGLPIIRTSVDHGTAFEIAGKGIASVVSMEAALDLAIDLAVKKAGKNTIS
ncbi:MAG TPA: 4-hydroxythreonine-4-phosphate dehydrogenase PdxA [Desulfosporosinus sp.]|nr:4-hydroxythreonine-4-phosphate dehydrogenase PdxA [Desulfosporosinus sp.]